MRGNCHIPGYGSTRYILVMILSFLLGSVIFASTSQINIPHVFRAGDVISASQINTNFQVLQNRIDALLEKVTATPVGSIMPFGGTSDKVPRGWLICDGREISREKYAMLFSVISINFGEGDGVETFNLPDFRGMFLRGANRVGKESRNDMYADPDFEHRVWYNRSGNPNRILPHDEGIGTYQYDELKKHNHQYLIPYGNAGRDSYGDNLFFYTRPAVTDDFGGNETRPKNMATHFIIKY